MRDALARDGFEQVTIEGLAADAGVAKQTIYRWWPSKSEILGEALLEGDLPGSDQAMPVSADLADDLREWLLLSGTHLTRPENVALARALIAVTASNADLGERLNRRFADPIITAIADRIATAQDRGEVRGDIDRVAIAELLLATTSYSALLARPLRSERVDGIVSALVDGIRT